MSGIVGLIEKRQVSCDRHSLNLMADALSYRGPDGRGSHIIGPVGLGHCRLSIIDPETGQQPMANEDQKIWITFNGEIYNYKELRWLLKKDGHHFKTQSDTEVIVHAYEKWGVECVKYFRGMFAFAILDQREQKIFLARDPFGIKPLVYLDNTDWFAFASEIQAIKMIPGLDLTLDLQAMDQYLWLQYIPAPLTIFQEIKKLPAGSYLEVDFDGQHSGPVRYWQPLFAPDHRKKNWTGWRSGKAW